MRRVSLVLLFLAVLAPVECWAHRHVAGAFVSRREARRSDIDGTVVGFEKAFCRERAPSGKCDKAHPVSLQLGFGHINGEHEGATLGQLTLLAGPRFTYPFESPEWLQFFAHALVGSVRESTGAQRDWSPTGSFGGGFEITFAKIGDHGLEFFVRPQVDWSWIRADETDWFEEYSLGLGVRF
jgi:hypothetical protein